MQNKINDLVNNLFLVVDEMVQKRLDEMEEKQPPTKLLYNLKELEVITGISHNALKARIRRGTLKGFKSQNIWLVSHNEVMRFITDLEG